MLRTTCLPALLALSFVSNACFGVVRGPESCSEAEAADYDPALRGRTYTAGENGEKMGLFERSGTISMRTTWSTRGAAHATIPTDHPLIIVLSSKQRLMLPAVSQATPVMKTSAFTRSITTEWTLDSRVDGAELAALAETGITSAYLNVGGIEMAMKVKPRASAHIQTLANCYAGQFQR